MQNVQNCHPGSSPVLLSEAKDLVFRFRANSSKDLGLRLRVKSTNDLATYYKKEVLRIRSDRLWIGMLILFLVYGLGAGLSPAGSQDRELESGSVNLNLTDDQAQAFQELRNRFRQELIQVRKKMATKRLELRSLSEEEFQGLRGEEIRRDLQALFLNGRERALVYQSEALKILRADQKEKLPSGSDLGFRCQWGSLMGGGPGRDFRRNRNHPALPSEKTPIQP